MLVITRRSDESIVIGDNIEIKIADISGEKVRLCIDAPRDIIIMRKELLETAELNKKANLVQQNAVLSELKLKALNLSNKIKNKQS